MMDETSGQSGSRSYRAESRAPLMTSHPAIKAASSEWRGYEKQPTAVSGLHPDPTGRLPNWWFTGQGFWTHGAWWRVRACLLAGTSGLILLIGVILSPRPGGYGTHEQLGLAACGIMERYHLPCPACGLTTSVSSMARGQVRLAFRAHPFGPFLFAGLVLAFLASAAELAMGRDLLKWLGPGSRWFWALAGGILLGWGMRLVSGLADGTLPIPGRGPT